MKRGLFIVAVTVLALAGAASTAAAQRNATQAEAEIGRLLDDARAFYDNLELDQADAALERAVQLGERWNLRSRTFAEVHVQRGILAHVRDKDQERAVSAFRDALRVDPTIRLDPLVSTPSLEKLFDQARRELGPAAGGGGGGGDDGAGASGDEVSHRPPARVPPDENVELEIQVSPEVDQRLYRVYLYFKSAREPSAQRLEMRPQGDRSFGTRIPARYVTGKILSYYVIVEDRTGRAIAGVRSADDPVKVKIGTELDDLASGDSLTGGGGGGDEEDEGDEGFGDGGSKKRQYVWLTLSVGSGGGFITDRAQPQNQTSADIRPGAALAPFHTMVELDFWATKRFALGAYARIQIIEFAHLEGGRLKFMALDQGPHHVVVRGGGGVGKVRHLVDLGNVLDTTLEGPFHYTLGASYVFDFTPTLGFVVSPDFMHLIGDSPSFHFDINAGLKIGF